jgi:hypothetical protein
MHVYPILRLSFGYCFTPTDTIGITLKGDWSNYTDTSEPVVGYGAQNMVIDQSGFRTSDLLITGPISNQLR